MNHLNELLNGGDYFRMQMLLTFFCVDIIFNLVCEQPLEDNLCTEFIHQNVSHYVLSRNFLRDLLVILPFGVQVNMGDSRRIPMILDRIHHIYHRDRLNESNDHESGFNHESRRRFENKEFALFGDEHHLATFYDIFMLLALFKLTDQERIIRSKKRMDLILEQILLYINMTSMMRKRFLMLVEILEILLFLMFAIHFVNCVWMYTSDNVHQSLMEIYVKNVPEEAIGNMQNVDSLKIANEVFFVYSKNMYLTILYLSVIGYGDPVSMPDLNSFKTDYTKLFLCMLFGFFVFQYINAQLNNFISSIDDEQTLETMKESVLEKLEQYFLFHNQMKGPKMLLVKDMEEWKKVVELGFQYNYREIKRNEFFKELFPRLQIDLMAQLVKREVRFFPLFFQN